MLHNRKIQFCLFLAVVFFLIFQGMRIPLTEPGPKPKPRPRAVLKLFSPATSTAGKLAQQKHQHTPTCTPSVTVTPIVVTGRLLPVAPASIRASITQLVPIGRAPPFS